MIAIQKLHFDHLSRSYHRRIFDDVIAVYGTGPATLAGIKRHEKRQISQFLSRIRNSSQIAQNYLRTITGSEDNIVEKLRALRPITREDVEIHRATRNFDRNVLFSIYEERTSGSSSGTPFKVFRSAHSVQREMLRLRYVLSYYARHYQTAIPKHIMYLSHYAGARSYYHVDETAKDKLSIRKLGFSVSGAAEFRCTALPNPFALSATPSSLNHILTLARQGIGSFRIKPEFILAAGEHTPDALRHQISDEFDCPVFELYVMREAGLIGFQCVEQDAFHLFAGDHILSNFKGDLTMTDLTNDYDFFINYLTDDSGIVSQPGPCPCGENLPTLFELRGRPFGKPYPPLYEGSKKY